MSRYSILAFSCLSLFVVLFSGCTAGLKLRNLEDNIVMDPVVYERDEPVNISNFQGHPEDMVFYKAITESLENDYDLEVIHRSRQNRRQNSAEACGYNLDVCITPAYEGSGWNFLITFPGFILFAPSWNGYYYDATLNTVVKVSDSTGKVVATVEENPVFELSHMDFGRSFWAYSGWWMPGWGLTSLLAGAFMTEYDTDATFDFQAAADKVYGQKIADRIVETLNRLGGDDRPAVTRPVTPVTKLDG